MGEGDTLVNAVIGAVVTVVLSFTGFSPILGGGVAGYLHRGERMEGAKVGAISGAIATVPFLLLIFVVFGFLGLFAVGGGRGGLAFGAFGFVIFLIAFVAALLWNVGLSAVGGYVGVYLHEQESGGHQATGGQQPPGTGPGQHGGQQSRDDQSGWGDGQADSGWDDGQDGDDRRSH